MKDDVDDLYVKIELVVGISFIRDIDLCCSLVCFVHIVKSFDN